MGFSAKQIKALKRNLDHRYVRTREVAVVSSPISKAGTRFQKRTGFSGSMAGIAKQSTLVACLPAKTAARSLRYMRRA